MHDVREIARMRNGRKVRREARVMKPATPATTQQPTEAAPASTESTVPPWIAEGKPSPLTGRTYGVTKGD